MMKKILVSIFIFNIYACSSVNVRTDGKLEDSSSPSFQKRYTYWWWGLKGGHSINVREVCEGKRVIQMQAVTTFSDSLLTLITLGVYSPRTARVWCAEEDK